MPNLLQVARDCEAFGAEGITVHPRPDQRHIRYDDIPALMGVVTTELNVEGNPTPELMKLLLEHRPHQATLVPDAPAALTSTGGWDTLAHQGFLKDIIGTLQSNGIRVSVFLDPIPAQVEGAKACGADRIEFYTGPYAKQYPSDPEEAVRAHRECAELAHQLGLGLNAGHDLNLENLAFYRQEVPYLQEVSIGHALICDALYYGLRNAIQMYLSRLKS
jgi:pyridoxine 5-phosphate synthase